MGLAAFNRMRREAKAEIQAEAIAPLSPTPSPPSVDLAAALKLINTAQQPIDLAPLPGIGKGAGRIILNKRPENGYGAVAQVQELCPELTEVPYRIDWNAVEVWEVEK